MATTSQHPTQIQAYLLFFLFLLSPPLIAQSADTPNSAPSSAQVSIELQTQHDAARKQLAQTQSQLDRVNDYRSNAEKRIKLIESADLRIDAKTGQLLRQQRLSLPTTYSLRKQLKQVNIETTNAEIELLDLTETPPPLVASPEPHSPPTLVNQYQAYITTLRQLSEATKTTLNATENYTNYLDERLLWIPSAQPINSSDFTTELDAIASIFSKQSLGELSDGLLKDCKNFPILWIIATLAFTLLLAVQSKAKRSIETLAVHVQDRHCDSIKPSLLALFVTLVRSQVLPVALIFLAWRSPSPHSWSIGFSIAALSLSFLSFLKSLSVSHGLLDAHIETDKHKLKRIYFHSTWALYTIPIFLFLAFALPAATAQPAGRISFILAMFLSIAFTHSLLLPKKQLLAFENTPSWALKLLYFIGLALPLFFILAYAIGYIDSVQTLFTDTIISITLVGATALFASLCYRWILVARRNFAKHQARKKYQALRAAETNNTEESPPSLEELEATEVDITAVTHQTRRIVRFLTVIIIVFGLWNIWKPVLPALGALDKVSIVQAPVSSEPASHTTTSDPATPITDIAKTASGSNATTTDDSHFFHKGISLGDIFGVIIIVTFTLVAARNIPGLLELSVLRKLNLSPGGNYAITTVLRYGLIATGGLAAFAQVGVSWGSVKWLAAAVTLGIGFGLQEIFANFVAGIIILFERPIRLGDIVTIGDITGRVSQIKIRATTIKQFNNRELLVPNKEFITGQLINWSLADNMQRFEIPVGIAYGSDTQKATDILTKIVHDHPRVLDDPAPSVLFQAFGASSLDFILRGFVNHYDDLIETRSNLHYQIDAAFRDADIEIAFPQTDIHIRSLPEPLQVIHNQAQDD
ncbi:mechanosensitive ion channel domain-containing protein [Rubritalea tangerina]|uniref:Mechanosensitive ion channel domain-containing protein n=2 Tax=Rubritalea tangerina TaxID=430798 RepID=A0ABW4Z7W0_9BACT